MTTERVWGQRKLCPEEGELGQPEPDTPEAELEILETAEESGMGPASHQRVSFCLLLFRAPLAIPWASDLSASPLPLSGPNLG